MSLPTLAGPHDLAQWLGRGEFDAADWARADQLLDKVSALVRREATATWVDEDGALSEVPDQIPGLVIAVAARIWDNPTFQSQRTTGPFSVSFGPQVGLYLTDEERALLPSTTGTTGLWTLPTTRGDGDDTQTIYAPIDGSPGADPIPMIAPEPW